MQNLFNTMTWDDWIPVFSIVFAAVVGIVLLVTAVGVLERAPTTISRIVTAAAATAIIVPIAVLTYWAVQYLFFRLPGVLLVLLLLIIAVPFLFRRRR